MELEIGIVAGSGLGWVWGLQGLPGEGHFDGYKTQCKSYK